MKMKNHLQSLKVNIALVIMFSLLLNSCICNDDRIDVNEGRELFDEELLVIPYQEGDTISFISDNEIHDFVCSFREHEYMKGQPTWISHNECEGKRLMSKDKLHITLKTDLSSYYYDYPEVVFEDSVNIYFYVESSYFRDDYSVFRFNMRGHLTGGALLFLVDNEIYYEEDFRPGYSHSPSYSLEKHSTIDLNGTTYYNVISTETTYSNSHDLPYYYTKVFYNQEFGILQIQRSDGIIYDLFD